MKKIKKSATSSETVDADENLRVAVEKALKCARLKTLERCHPAFIKLSEALKAFLQK
jgi:hypothetical protein